jgi:pimeloyl-ACP methyl ester carboxylesterase
MHIYLLSGLGADHRAFQYLQLSPQHTCVHIVYVTPLPKETLPQYAVRISTQIDTSKPFAIIGLSFGGILTMELLSFLQPKKTILISSITNRKELPFLYRIAGKLQLHRLIPAKKVNRPNFFTYWFFGIKDATHKKLLGEILTSTHTGFSRWAVNEILLWKRTTTPPNIYRIHGTKDRLLPIKNFTPDYTIRNGGHLLILQNGAEVSAIVEKILQQ